MFFSEATHQDFRVIPPYISCDARAEPTQAVFGFFVTDRIDKVTCIQFRRYLEILYFEMSTISHTSLCSRRFLFSVGAFSKKKWPTITEVYVFLRRWKIKKTDSIGILVLPPPWKGYSKTGKRI